MTNDDRAPQGPRTQRPTVRPRWVWGGLLLALIGAATLGLGIAGTWWWPSVVGAALLLLGVAAGFAGGMMYDAVPTFSAREEMHQVAAGDVHEGVAPGGQVTSPAARRTAREATRSTRALESAAYAPVDVRWAQVAGWLLVLIAVVVTVAQANLVGHTPEGRWNSVRDTGLAVLVGLGGFRLALVPGRHSVAVGITSLAGLGLVLNGLLAEHANQGLAILEVVFGLLAALCSLAAWVSPMRKAEP